MTVQVTTRKAGPTPGNSLATVFPFAFKVFAATDIAVTLTTIATGVQSTLVLNSALGYTVALNADQNANPGGSITYNPVGVPLPATQTLTISSVVPQLQGTHILNGGAFFADNIEDAIDKAVINIQQMAEQANRSVRFPIVDAVLNAELPAAAQRANKWMSFDSAGNVSVTDAQSAAGTTVIATGSITARMLADRFGEILNVKDFGAVGNGVADDTAAFGTWTARINALGSAIAVIPPGTYNITVPKTAVGVCAFNNLKGLVLIAGGAVIADQQVYAGVETGLLFKFTACKNVALLPGLKVTAQNTSPGVNVRGTKVFQFSVGCQNLDLNYEQDGGLTGVEFYRNYPDPDSDRTRNYRLKLKASNMEYPVNGQFSGDDGVVDLDCTNCGRNFFYYGCSHLDIQVRSVNQQITSVIGAANGYGVIDAKVRYYDRESTACQNAAPVIQISWGDITPATIKDIDIHLNVKCPAGANRWGSTVGFDKINAGAPDVTGRGHRLENLTISGISEQVANNAHFSRITAFLFAGGGTPDVIKNIKVRDFIATGAAVSDDWSGLVGVLADTMVYQNVNQDNLIFVANGANGRVVFRDCKAVGGFNANQAGTTGFGDSGAGLVLIDTKNAAGSATIDFTAGLSADYDEYVVEISDMIPATNGTQLQMLGSSDNGGTWKNGAGAYVYEYGSQAGGGAIAAGGGAATFIGLTPVSVANGTGSLRATIEIAAPSQNAVYKHINFRTSFYETTVPSLGRTDGAALYAFNTALNGLRFQMSAGNITSGKFSLYGIRKS